MKYLILIFITTSLFAARGNYLSKDVINSGDTTGKPVYRLKDKCEAHYKQECFDITSKPVQYNKVIQVDVDDTDKPIYKLVEDKKLREKYEKSKADKEAAKLLKKSKKDAAREMLRLYDCKDYNFCKLLKDYLEL